MAAVTVHSDFGAKKIKSVTVSIVSPSICHKVMGPDAMIFIFWVLSFKPALSLSSFTFIKKLFNCSTGRGQFSFQSERRLEHSRECSNYCTVALMSHASKVLLKILQGRLLKYMNRELPDVEAEFRKGGGTRNQIANICWIIEKARKIRGIIHSDFCFLNFYTCKLC